MLKFELNFVFLVIKKFNLCIEYILCENSTGYSNKDFSDLVIGLIFFILKSGDKEASIETDDEDEDDESNIDNIDTSKFQNGFKITKRNLASLRCDLVLAAGLGVSRK